MPKVSVIIPCYNEEKRIGELLHALYRQTFPLAEMEVIIADGHSTDATRSVIAAFQAQHSALTLRVVDNNARSIPAALNTAIAAATGEIIVRLDAHSAPTAEYVSMSVAALEAGRGANVGGVWQIKPGADTWVARSIAAAAAHPLGVGDAMYRHASQSAAVDTVPFGCFYRALVDRIGAFDETLLTNEDYEFNARVRDSGGVVWLDAQIRSVYYARATFTELARQYWRYGFWKLKMLKRYPHTLRWRQALPPAFVSGALGGLLLVWWLPARLAWLAALSVYALALLAAGIHAAFRRKDAALVFGLPMAVAVMHFCWGGGFLYSMLFGRR